MPGTRKAQPRSKHLHVRLTEEEWRLMKGFCRSITAEVRPRLEPLFNRLRKLRQRSLTYRAPELDDG